jgi:hypothetical protein
MICKMTLDNFLGAQKLEEGHVVSVQATDGQMVHFMLAPDIHLFLTLYIRYIRHSVTGDHHSSVTLVFPTIVGPMIIISIWWPEVCWIDASEALHPY